MSNESSFPASSPVTRIELAAHLASGDPLDLKTRDETGRTVFASLLREILIDKELPRDPRGLTVLGARILDHLDLSYCTLPAPLRLRETAFHSVLTLLCATFTGELDLRDAELTGEDEDGNALVADRMRVNGSAFLNTLTAKGVIRLADATIEGELNMTEANLRGKDNNGNALVADGLQVNGNAMLQKLHVANGAIRLADTTINRALVLTDAELNGKDSEGNALVADRMRVNGGAFLNTLTAEGAVRLLGATITAELNMTEANLKGKDNAGIALVADGLQVNGNAMLGKLHVEKGEVWLAGATITGQLNLIGAKLNGKDGEDNALVADGVQVNGGASLNTLSAAGAVRLKDAIITGQLNLIGATLNGRDGKGNALVADRIRVNGGAFLNTLTAEGAVRLLGATITAELNMTEANLKGKDNAGIALVADGLQVNGGASLNTLRAEGAVRLTDAVITGQLNLIGATLNGKDGRGNALVADRLQVSGDAALGQLKVTHGATISLQDGRVGNLVLSKELPSSGWPRNNFVGLRYDQIDGPPATSAFQGARLLASQADGSRAAQPYWQLADYYARVGNDSASRRLRVWSNVLQAKAHARSWPRFAYGLTSGFGYYPFLALLWLVFLIGFDTVALDAHRNDFIPTKAPAVSVSEAKDQGPVTSTRCDPRYPCFNPVLYATDTVVPVISMGQQDAWRLDTSRAGVGLQVTLIVTTAFGWILTTLLVGGVGGLLRRT